MPVPTVDQTLVDAFKVHERIDHTRDDAYILQTILPAAIAKVIRTTDIHDGTNDDPPTQDDWADGLALETVFRIGGAMYESREVVIDVQPVIGELIALWRPSA